MGLVWAFMTNTIAVPGGDFRIMCLCFFFHFIIFSNFDEILKSRVAVGVVQYDDCATLPKTCVKNYEKINDQ